MDVATGCDMEIEPESRPHPEFRTDEELLAAYVVLPAIHPYIGIGSLPAVNHQREFAAHCVSPAAERALLDAAVAQAWTAIDTAAEETATARLTQRREPP